MKILFAPKGSRYNTTEQEINLRQPYDVSLYPIEELKPKDQTPKFPQQPPSTQQLSYQ
jgi:hypothetical protein